jgi:hypothetical protein
MFDWRMVRKDGLIVSLPNKRGFGIERLSAMLNFSKGF